MRKVCNRGRSARGFSWSACRASRRSPVHAPPFSAARRAMRLDRCGVDRQSHLVLAAARERFKDRLPMSALGPAIETIVDRRVRTIVGRAIAPARAALKHVNDTADEASIVFAPARSGSLADAASSEPAACHCRQNSPLRIEVPPAESTRGEGKIISYRP